MLSDVGNNIKSSVNRFIQMSCRLQCSGLQLHAFTNAIHEGETITHLSSI